MHIRKLLLCALPALLLLACEPDPVEDDLIEARIPIALLNSTEWPQLQYTLTLFKHAGGAHWTYTAVVNSKSDEECTGDNEGRYCKRLLGFEGITTPEESAAAPWEKIFANKNSKEQSCRPTATQDYRACFGGATLQISTNGSLDRFTFDNQSRRDLLPELTELEEILHDIFHRASPVDPKEAALLGSPDVPYPL